MDTHRDGEACEDRNLDQKLQNRKFKSQTNIESIIHKPKKTKKKKVKRPKKITFMANT
jgi:hypothetical protein